MTCDQGGEEGDHRARRHLATRSEHVTEIHDDALNSTTPRDAATSQITLLAGTRPHM
jgi:preprotein translocase subunit SecF